MTDKTTGGAIVGSFLATLAREVSELPDRTSPEGKPGAMICTAVELGGAALGALEHAGAVLVDARALRTVLFALSGPGHLIRELQATRGPMFDNPIDTLVEQFNAQI